MEENNDLSQTEWEGLRDEALFELMVKRDNLSYEAFDVFYDRYKDDFYRLLRRNSSEDLVKELFNGTFQKAFFKAHTFKSAIDLSTDAARGRTLAWLGTIAHRIKVEKSRLLEIEICSLGLDEDENAELLNEMTADGFVSKGELFHKLREVEDKLLENKSSEQDAVDLTFQQRVLQQVLSELPERDKEILLTYVEEIDPQIPNQKISRKTINKLKKKYGLTPENIRQIKKRTMKLVLERCLSQMKTGSQ